MSQQWWLLSEDISVACADDLTGILDAATLYGRPYSALSVMPPEGVLAVPFPCANLMHMAQILGAWWALGYVCSACHVPSPGQ